MLAEPSATPVAVVDVPELGLTVATPVLELCQATVGLAIGLPCRSVTVAV